MENASQIQPPVQSSGSPSQDFIEAELFEGEIGKRRVGAYTMRVKSRASYRDIARAYNISIGTAYNDVKSVRAFMRSMTFETLEEVRHDCLERLDVLLFAHMPAAKAGDINAALLVLRIEKRRADLLGLDAAHKVEMTGEGGGPIETNTTINIREKWTPSEALSRANELMRRMEILNNANQRIAEEKARKQAERN